MTDVPTMQFGRGRKPFTHNACKRTRSKSNDVDGLIDSEIPTVQVDLSFDDLADAEEVEETKLEPIINEVQTLLIDSANVASSKTEVESFFTEYLMGATLIQGDNIEVSNKKINVFIFLIFNT
jgi:hypothetical protein